MHLRRLHLDASADRDIAAGLFLATPSYEFDNLGRLPTGASAESLPHRFPDSCAPEHRLSFAAFRQDEPVALVQIGLHIPDPDCAALLMLLVPTVLQHQHIGCEVVERLSRQARRWPGIKRWYINVMSSNADALAFWRHCGFRTSSQDLNCSGFRDSLHVLTRPVKARPACQGHAVEQALSVKPQHMFARLP